MNSFWPVSIASLFTAVSFATGCSSDESTTSASEASGSDAATSGGPGATAGQTSSGNGGAGAAGGASSASSSSGQGGAGGTGDGCAGKACGSACLTRAGNGMCDPSGSCVVVPVQCPGYAPCTNVKCGTVCSSCDPTDPTCVPAQGTVCDITQVCIFPPPACD